MRTDFLKNSSWKAKNGIAEITFNNNNFKCSVNGINYEGTFTISQNTDGNLNIEFSDKRVNDMGIWLVDPHNRFFILDTKRIEFEKI